MTTVPLTPPRRWSRAELTLGGVLALFVLALALLVAGALGGRAAVLAFAPSVRADTLTIDARDDRAWHFVRLADLAVTRGDGAGWDVAVRRFRLIARDSVADLGEVSFDSVTAAPLSGWTRTAFGHDTVTAALRHWYRYGWTSHRLESRRRVYVVPTAGGGWMKVQLLSYYCPPADAGCVTLRAMPVGAPATAPAAASAASETGSRATP